MSCRPGCSSWHSLCRAWEGLLRIWVGLSQAGLSEPAHQRPICQTFPRDGGEQTQGKGGKEVFLWHCLLWDFSAFYRGFMEKWVSLLEGNVEMLETQYSLQRWGVRLWALLFQKKTLRTPSWPWRCEVGWIHLLPPNSFRQSGGENKFIVWLL